MLNEVILEGRVGTATSTRYEPTARDREIFYALFIAPYSMHWNNPLFQSEPIPVEEPSTKQLAWYDEEGLNAIWAEIGDQHVALAEMGMEDYILNLQQLDEE